MEKLEEVMTKVLSNSEILETCNGKISPAFLHPAWLTLAPGAFLAA